jgi:L-alanine-DL-glutamate epimerase-like enolase superfamily enzyme
MALFDAVGRALGEPCWARFGGEGVTLETDLTLVTGTAEATARAARAAVAKGIHTLKVKVGALSPLADAERMLAVAGEAPNATLLADANAAWTADEALAFLGELERLRVPLALLEQPVAADDLSGLVRVQERTSALVCADESARSAADVVELARRRAVRAINVKTQKTGVVEAIDVLAVARAAGLQVMIGGMVESVLSMSFSACLAAGRAEFVDLDTPMFIAAHPFVGGYEQRGAELDLSGIRAGHGVRLRG